MLFSLPKFVRHEDELAQFVRYGLPDSSAIVDLVGTLELVAGLMLVLGVATRLAASGLAADMAGAVATAGIQVGGLFHLGVAPLLLLSMLYLLWAGSGAAAIDRTLSERLAPTPGEREGHHSAMSTRTSTGHPHRPGLDRTGRRADPSAGVEAPLDTGCDVSGAVHRCLHQGPVMA